jgi:Tfp pilus assembly major pilin PilA
VWWIGGVVAGAVLIAFGIVVIVLAINGQHTLKNELKNQQITGTPDMTPTAIKAEAEKAGLQNVDLPTCDVAGKAINSGTKARCFVTSGLSAMKIATESSFKGHLHLK